MRTWSRTWRAPPDPPKFRSEASDSDAHVGDLGGSRPFRLDPPAGRDHTRTIGLDEATYREREGAYWAYEGATPHEERVTLDRTGTTVRVQTLGQGPPVLFVHGASNCGTSWAALASRMPSFRCLLLDRPGCGLSEPLTEPFHDIDSFASFADTLLVDALDALDIERAAIVSTSLGGYFALRTAAAQPDRIDRVVHLGWTIGAPMAHLPLVMRMVGAVRPVGRLMARVPLPERAVRSMLAQIGLRQALEAGRVPQEFIDWFGAMLRYTHTVRNDTDVMPPMFRPTGGIDDDLLFTDNLLGSMRVPVDFLWGAEDPMGGADIATDFVPRIPGATLQLIEGGGHAVWIDHPDDIAAATNASLSADR